MPDPLVQVEGGRELRRTLKQAGVDIKQLRDVHKHAASIVSDRGRTTAPRRSGALAASVRAGATQRAGVIRAGKKRVPYANPIHWGWKRRNIKPQPWLSQAAQATEPAWVQQYYERLTAVIDQIEGL